MWAKLPRVGETTGQYSVRRFQNLEKQKYGRKGKLIAWAKIDRHDPTKKQKNHRAMFISTAGTDGLHQTVGSRRSAGVEFTRTFRTPHDQEGSPNDNSNKTRLIRSDFRYARPSAKWP